MAVAKQATTGRQSAASYLMLALLTGCTAFFYLFCGAPSFADAAKFEECDGKCVPTSFSEGYGRVLSSMYTLAAGNLHLMTSIVAWGAFVSTRDEQKVIQDLRIRQKWDEFQKRGLHGNTESHSLSNGRVAAGLARTLDL